MSDGQGSKKCKIGSAAPSVVRIRGGKEIKSEIIEALAHDLGKASQGRFEDHAAASTELLRRAGFGDEAVLMWKSMSIKKKKAWCKSTDGRWGKERNPKKSAEEGRNDINTRFFAEGKKGTFL